MSYYHVKVSFSPKLYEIQLVEFIPIVNFRTLFCVETKNLNGIYFNFPKIHPSSAQWSKWKGQESLKKIEMKIRPQQ